MSKTSYIFIDLHTYIVESQLLSEYDDFRDFTVDSLDVDDISGDSLVQKVNFILSHRFCKQTYLCIAIIIL